jgi:hypothetical protein
MCWCFGECYDHPAYILAARRQSRRRPALLVQPPVRRCACGYYRSFDGTAAGPPIGRRLPATPALRIVQSRLFEDAA